MSGRDSGREDGERKGERTQEGMGKGEVGWATTGRVAAPSIAFDGGLRLYQGGDH